MANVVTKTSRDVRSKQNVFRQLTESELDMTSTATVGEGVLDVRGATKCALQTKNVSGTTTTCKTQVQWSANGTDWFVEGTPQEQTGAGGMAITLIGMPYARVKVGTAQAAGILKVMLSAW